MANNEHLNGVSELNVEVDIGNLNGENVGGNGNQRLGTVRDRLFHAMVVKVAVSYSSNVSPRFRTLIEFVVLSFVSFFLYFFGKTILIVSVFRQFVCYQP